MWATCRQESSKGTKSKLGASQAQREPRFRHGTKPRLGADTEAWERRRE